mgnify:CR=1 FL=1
MSASEVLKVESVEALEALMARSVLWAVWVVRCEVGPDWFGAEHKVTFEVGERPLADTALHRALVDALVEALEIPEACKDAVIRGEARIDLKDGVLVADYEWQCAAPYMYPRSSGDGQRPFMVLGELRKMLSA